MRALVVCFVVVIGVGVASSSSGSIGSSGSVSERAALLAHPHQDVQSVAQGNFVLQEMLLLRQRLGGERTRPRSVPVRRSAPLGSRCDGPRVRWIRPALGLSVIRFRVFDLLIPCVFNWFHPHVALATIRCIAERESHGYPFARNPSGASGIFQLMDWQQRARFWLRPAWFPGHPWTVPWRFVLGPWGWTDARANTIMAMRIMASEGLGPWSGGC